MRRTESTTQVSHCNKPVTHKTDDCFSLPKNEEKIKAAVFVDGKFAKQVE